MSFNVVTPAQFRQELTEKYGAEMVHSVLDDPNKFTSDYRPFQSDIAKYYKAANANPYQAAPKLNFGVLESIFSSCVLREQQQIAQISGKNVVVLSKPDSAASIDPYEQDSKQFEPVDDEPWVEQTNVPVLPNSEALTPAKFRQELEREHGLLNVSRILDEPSNFRSPYPQGQKQIAAFQAALQSNPNVPAENIEFTVLKGLARASIVNYPALLAERERQSKLAAENLKVPIDQYEADSKEPEKQHSRWFASRIHGERSNSTSPYPKGQIVERTRVPVLPTPKALIPGEFRKELEKQHGRWLVSRILDEPSNFTSPYSKGQKQIAAFQAALQSNPDVPASNIEFSVLKNLFNASASNYQARLTALEQQSKLAELDFGPPADPADFDFDDGLYGPPNHEQEVEAPPQESFKFYFGLPANPADFGFDGPLLAPPEHEEVEVPLQQQVQAEQTQQTQHEPVVVPPEVEVVKPTPKTLPRNSPKKLPPKQIMSTCSKATLLVGSILSFIGAVYAGMYSR